MLSQPAIGVQVYVTYAITTVDGVIDSSFNKESLITAKFRYMLTGVFVMKPIHS